MTFHKERLPEPANYFESEGLVLKGPSTAPWKTTKCDFHGGSDSMRVNVKNGTFKCMNCGEGGGPIRIGGRLNWPTKGLKKLLGVA